MHYTAEILYGVLAVSVVSFVNVHSTSATSRKSTQVAIQKEVPQMHPSAAKSSQPIKATKPDPLLAKLILLNKLCPSLNPAKNGLGTHYAITSAISEARNRFDIDEALVYAVMTAESRCRSTARSHAGAMGLMQLMPGTAKWLGVSQPYSVRENIHGGAQYLAYLSKKFKGDLKLTLAAYNSGPRIVRKYGGVPPNRETKNFVRTVTEFYHQYRTAHAAPTPHEGDRPANTI